MIVRAILGIARAVRSLARAVNILRALHCYAHEGPYCCTLFRPFRNCFCMCLGMGEHQVVFLKSKGFLRNAGHWKKHGFETFSGFEKQGSIARCSARNGRATKVIFFEICAHYGKNAPLRARRVEHRPHSRRASDEGLSRELVETKFFTLVASL